jgi:hypothetical protein
MLVEAFAACETIADWYSYAHTPLGRRPCHLTTTEMLGKAFRLVLSTGTVHMAQRGGMGNSDAKRRARKRR